MHDFIKDSQPVGVAAFMSDTLYGLHTCMDAAAEPAGAVQVSAAASYVQPPMHCPFNARFASVQHKGAPVGAADVGVGAAVMAVGFDKSPNNPVAGAAVFAIDIAPDLPAF